MGLTHAKIRSLTRAGRYGDAQGLHLRVSAGGTKAFILRKVVDGKRRDIPVGTWPDTSLAAARMKAAEIRLTIERGEYQPEAQEKKAPTFKEIALETHAVLSPGWRNEKGRRVWLQRMENHIFPRLGSKKIDQISRADVIECLSPLWTERRETSRKLLQYLNSVFRMALAKNLIENNPANTDALRGALPRLPMNRENLPAVRWQEFPSVYEAVETSKASLASKLCFAWVSFTLVRGGEGRGAQWEEVTPLEERLWRVPGSRMKTGKPHNVPLSDQAMQILNKAEALRDESGLLFPSPMTGRPISDATMMIMLHKLGLKGRMSVHGTRSCFRSWAYDQGKPREISEAILSHSTGDLVERAYIRTSALELRARVLSEWGAFVVGS